MTAARARGERCVSRLQLDRSFAGELSADEQDALGDHLAECAYCAHTHAALLRWREQVPAALPDLLRARAAVPARGSALPLLLSAAAMFALGFVGFGLGLRSDALTRSKGSGSGQFFVLHEGKVRRAAERERVQPGDRIELAYSSEQPTQLAILSVDGAQHVSAYFEADGYTVALPPARDKLLESSTRLDATLGDESIYVLFCEQKTALAPLMAALERAPHTLPAGACHVELHTFLKVAE